VCLFIVISAVVGWRWNWRRWLVSAGIFYFLYAFFFTTYFTNFHGFASGIWDSLGYWLVQHGENRLYQPWYFYIMLLSVYEFLPLLFALGGMVYYGVKRSLFTTFLIYWFVASLILFSWAGEKAPWLVVHITLPVILLGGKFCGDMLGKAIYVDIIQEALAISKSGAGKFWDGVRSVVKADRLRALAAVVVASSFVFLLVFSVHAAWRDNYRHDDHPVEMLDYAQVSYDMNKVMRQIEELARQTGKGKELKITVDNDLWWPLGAWYLRNYKVEGYGGSGTPQGDVLLLAIGHQSEAAPYLATYGEGQNFNFLLWFPTTYEGVWPKTMGDSQGWRGWWRYLTSRETNLSYWNSQGIAYFPKESAAASLPTGAEVSYNSAK
jgi:uncharacterized protein (TIGR03663 family)